MTDNFQHQEQPKKIDSLTSHDAQEIVSFISGKFEDFKQARAGKEKKWKECIKAFLNQHNHEVAGTRKWRSQIYIPLSYEAATNIYSNIKRALFPTDSSFFTIEGRSPDAKRFSNTIKTSLVYQLDDINFITKFGTFLKQLVIIGNSAAAIYWKKVTRKVKEKVQVPIFDDNGIPTSFEEQVIEVDRTVYNTPEFETINMNDIVFDPAVSNNWEDGLVIHRAFRNYEQVINNPVYKNTEALEISCALEEKTESNEYSDAFGTSDQKDTKSSQVKLLSAYGDFKVGNKIYFNHIAVIANDKHLIRFESNPYPEKPFVFCTYEHVPNELYGIGVIEPGLGIQYLVNTFSNQKSDVLSLIINGMWAYVDDGIIDPEEIIAKPGSLIAVKDINNIKPLHPDKSVALGYNEIAQLKAEYQEVTGATKYFTGGPSVEFSKTATEVAALQSAGIVRFSEVIQNIEQNALKRAIKLIFLYNNVFNNINRPIDLEDEDTERFAHFAKDYLMENFDLRIVGANSSISRDIRVNKLMEFIKMVGNTPIVAQQVNLMELIKHLYRELGFKDEGSIFAQQ